MLVSTGVAVVVVFVVVVVVAAVAVVVVIGVGVVVIDGFVVVVCLPNKLFMSLYGINRGTLSPGNLIWSKGLLSFNISWRKLNVSLKCLDGS